MLLGKQTLGLLLPLCSREAALTMPLPDSVFYGLVVRAKERVSTWFVAPKVQPCPETLPHAFRYRENIGSGTCWEKSISLHAYCSTIGRKRVASESNLIQQLSPPYAAARLDLFLGFTANAFAAWFGAHIHLITLVTIFSRGTCDLY